MSEYLIQFNNISNFFGKVIALKDVTMQLKKGEIMCLLGDNGAGKSTILKVLNGVHVPNSGAIEVAGIPLTIHTPAASRAAGIAMNYQEMSLVPTLSVICQL